MRGRIYSTATCTSRAFVTSKDQSLTSVPAVAPSRQASDKIIAVDNAPAVVDHYKLEGLDIRLGTAYELPFEDASASGVFSCWLLEHLDDPLRCLTEVKRVLRPGGYACFIVPSVESLNRGFYDDYTHLRPFSQATMKQLAEDARFAVSVLLPVLDEGTAPLDPLPRRGTPSRHSRHVGSNLPTKPQTCNQAEPRLRSLGLAPCE